MINTYCTMFEVSVIDQRFRIKSDRQTYVEILDIAIH